MKTGRAKRHRKGKEEDTHFARLEVDMILHCKEWKELSASAKLLYIYVKSKYNTFNNGEIKLSYSELKGVVGISSSRTISKAQAELVESGWIKKTGHGGLFKYSNLYELTWRHDRLM